MNKTGLFSIENRKKLAWAVLAVLVFFAGISASYLLLGSKFPWASKFWIKLANVLPLPVATVDGKDVSLHKLRVAERLGSPDPMNFVIRQTAIVALAEKNGIQISEHEILEREEALTAELAPSLREQLTQKNVALKDFREIILMPELAREKLVVKLQSPSTSVQEVTQKLRDGQNFGVVASMYSQDPVTASLNGDAGFLSRGQIYEPLWEKALALSNGEWTGPESTPQGFVFVRKVERQNPSELNPERLHLQFILIRTFDFDAWLLEQMEKMRVVIYI